MSKVIAKLQEPRVNAEYIICAADKKGKYITKNVYYDNKGNREGESIGWTEHSERGMRKLLTIHFELHPDRIEEIINANK